MGKVDNPDFIIIQLISGRVDKISRYILFFLENNAILSFKISHSKSLCKIYADVK